uniref:Tf2-1-like SH3-like domain-containing protein n=1 Tax=Cajanus cajan TaxID=3821 RepID=A0A151RN40_CAJCA|nr:hypothetical protein KK1_034553 [Cajanus cajan]
MKKYVDQKRVHMEFQVGDLVIVKPQLYRQHSVAFCKNQKVSLRYFGPFPLMKRIGPVAYKLSLPPIAKIHPSFACFFIEIVQRNISNNICLLPFLTNEFGPVIQLLKALQSKVILQENLHIPRVLV